MQANRHGAPPPAPSLTLPVGLLTAGAPGGPWWAPGRPQVILTTCVPAWGLPLGFQNQRGWLLFCSHEGEGWHWPSPPPHTGVQGAVMWMGSTPPSPFLLPPALSAVRQPGPQQPWRGDWPRAPLTPTPLSRKAPSLWRRRPGQLWSWMASEGSIYHTVWRELLCLPIE